MSQHPNGRKASDDDTKGKKRLRLPCVRPPDSPPRAWGSGFLARQGRDWHIFLLDGIRRLEMRVGCGDEM